MEKAWEKAVEAARAGQDPSETISLTLDGALKCSQCRLPPPALFEQFSRLQHLSIANAGLTSLEGFPCLPHLKRLVLSDNRIAGGLEYLVQAGLRSLQDLDLSNNRLQGFDDLAPLSQLNLVSLDLYECSVTRLVSLDLYECSVTRLPDYCARVFGIVKSLQYLDKTDVDGKEKFESDDDCEELDSEDGELGEEEEDYGTEYLVQPIGKTEDDEGGSDFEPVEGDGEDDELDEEENRSRRRRVWQVQWKEGM